MSVGEEFVGRYHAGIGETQRRHERRVDMRRWHREFERTAPDDHQEFLQYLHIPEEEIRSIREWSRKPKD